MALEFDNWDLLWPHILAAKAHIHSCFSEDLMFKTTINCQWYRLFVELETQLHTFSGDPNGDAHLDLILLLCAHLASGPGNKPDWWTLPGVHNISSVMAPSTCQNLFENARSAFSQSAICSNSEIDTGPLGLANDELLITGCSSGSSLTTTGLLPKFPISKCTFTILDTQLLSCEITSNCSILAPTTGPGGPCSFWGWRSLHCICSLRAAGLWALLILLFSLCSSSMNNWLLIPTAIAAASASSISLILWFSTCHTSSWNLAVVPDFCSESWRRNTHSAKDSDHYNQKILIPTRVLEVPSREYLMQDGALNGLGLKIALCHFLSILALHWFWQGAGRQPLLWWCWCWGWCRPHGCWQEIITLTGTILACFTFSDSRTVHCWCCKTYILGVCTQAWQTGSWEIVRTSSWQIQGIHILSS